jgi:membrane fusion protein (multidrug efflux system)
MFDEGALVKAGQPLFQLDARPLALAVASAKAAVASAEADIARADAATAQTQRERDRLASLAAANAISRKEADDASSSAQISAAETQAAHARLEQAKAQLKEAQLNLEYATITAPISGMVGRALRQEGSLVGANGDSLLTTLVQLDPLEVSFNVGDGDRQRMSKDIVAGTLVVPADGFNVRLLQRDGSELGHGGKINFISSTISNQTGTQEMRARLANPAGSLKSGLFVRVVLEGATRPEALTVPQRAVLEGPGGKTVMVAEAGKDGQLLAQSRVIEVGDWTNSGSERLWVVQSGLKAGDRVIVDNLMKLRPGAPVTLAKPGTATPPAEPVKN